MLTFYLVCLVAGMLFGFFMLSVYPSYKLYRMVQWLEMDLVDVHERIVAREHVELFEDIYEALREKCRLFCYKTRRVAINLQQGSALDTQSARAIITKMDSVLEHSADPDSVVAVWGDLIPGFSLADQKAFAPYIQEWQEIRYWNHFYEQVLARRLKDILKNKEFRGP